MVSIWCVKCPFYNNSQKPGLTWSESGQKLVSKTKVKSTVLVVVWLYVYIPEWHKETDMDSLISYDEWCLSPFHFLPTPRRFPPFPSPGVRSRAPVDRSPDVLPPENFGAFWCIFGNNESVPPSFYFCEHFLSVLRGHGRLPLHCLRPWPLTTEMCCDFLDIIYMCARDGWTDRKMHNAASWLDRAASRNR